MAKFNLHNEIDNKENFMSNLISEVSAVRDGEDIEINMSSFGGDVMLGMPLGETLLKHRGHTKMIIDGACGSMGAFLATYFDETVATRGATFMFHKASCNASDADHGAKKTVNIVNANFRMRMEERGINNAMITRIFDDGEEVYLSAKEAETAKVIDRVIKTERKSGNPIEMIVATIPNFIKKIMSKKNKFVVVALMDGDKKELLAVFETPNGVIEEGTVLMPVEGTEMVAGDYTFEGNVITVDGAGKVTAIKPAETLEAKKDDKEKTVEAVGEEAVQAMVDKAITAGFEKIQASIETALSKVGSSHIIKASFDDKSKGNTEITPRIMAKTAESTVRAKVVAKNSKK